MSRNLDYSGGGGVPSWNLRISSPLPPRWWNVGPFLHISFIIPSYFVIFSSYILHNSFIFLHSSSYVLHISSYNFLHSSFTFLHIPGTYKNSELPPRLWDLEIFRSFPLYKGSGTEKIPGSSTPSNTDRRRGKDLKHDLDFLVWPINLINKPSSERSKSLRVQTLGHKLNHFQSPSQCRKVLFHIFLHICHIFLYSSRLWRHQGGGSQIPESFSTVR